MKIIVTAYEPNAHLLENFTKLFNRFWGEKIIVDIAKENELKSLQIKRILNSIDDEYFILMSEDLYFLKEIRKDFFQKVEGYVKEHKIDRFSLQSRGDGYEECSEYFDTLDGEKLYKLTNDAEYLCSLEISIWKKEFLQNNLYVKGSDRDIETNTSLEARIKGNMLVIVPENKIVVYTDALRGGKPRIEVRDNEMFMLTPDGYSTTGIFL